MIVLFLIIILLSITNFKESVIFTAAVLVFMNNLSSGIEGVKLFYGVVAIHVFLFFLFHYKTTNNKYPLLILIPTSVAGIVYIISSYVGVMHEYAKNIVNISAWFVYPYILWHVLSSKKDVIMYGNVLFSFFIIVGLYAILELLIGQNVFSLWAEQIGIMQGEVAGVESEKRFGLLRCNSILPYNSALGMNSSLIFLVFVVLKVKLHRKFPLPEILFYLMPICVLLSGTRSQFIVFAICVIGILLSKEYRRIKEIRNFVVISVIVALLFSSFFFGIIDSIINSDSSATEGSNLKLRLSQFAIAASFWEQSPWFGHGRNYTWEVAIPDNSALMGAESIVFTQLIDHGLIGLLCFYAIGICLAIWSFNFSRPLAALPISFMVGKTLSTVVGVEYNIPIILCVFVVRVLMVFNKTNYAVKCKRLEKLLRMWYLRSVLSPQHY